MIVVVSGLPRSGTSMLMQMLKAGGLTVLSEDAHTADTYNPKGYFEWARMKELQATPELIAAAEGKAVKVFSPFLPFLSKDHEFRVVLMHRPLAEVLRSQAEMLRQGNNKKSLALEAQAVEDGFKWHLANVDDWRAARPNMRFLKLDYHFVLREPTIAAHELAIFLEKKLDLAAMARAVDPKLYRIRAVA